MHRGPDFIMQTQEQRDAVVLEHIRANAVVSTELNVSGAENMRRDEHNAQLLVQQPEPVVYVRLYSWDPWCVSLGAHQREDDIDHERRKDMGFDCVRRATGGRAVFHADELTYSIVMVLPHGTGMHDVYRVSHFVLRDALHAIGATDVSFQKTQPDFAARYRTEGDSVSCFTSAARSELLWNDKKVVGSAQRVYGNVLLQHGSILLSPAHVRLVDCLRMPDERSRERLRSSLLRHSVSLHEILGHSVSVQACAEAVSAAFLHSVD